MVSTLHTSLPTFYYAALVAGGAGSRPFSPLTWALPDGNFDLSSLGWGSEEDEGLGLPKVLSLAEQKAAEAPAAGGKRPASAGERDKGSEN